LFPPPGFVGFDVRFSSHRRFEALRAGIEDVGHVGELALLRPHFRFDAVQLPCPTLRAAERANRHRLSVMQRRQLLEFGEQFLLDL
jgi:hypothetical protein